LEEISEKLKQQENEMHTLKEIIAKTFENFSPQQVGKSATPTTDDQKANKPEVNKTEAESNNTEITDERGPELPLPVPDLFKPTT